MSIRGSKSETSRAALLDAANNVLRSKGYSGLSTREVALAAGMPLSQIHYHFGSKERMVLELFEYLNEQLLSRQSKLFESSGLKLSEQWSLACDYLDEDLASGYVRILHELWTAGYANPDIAAVVRKAITGWQRLLARLARKAQDELGLLPGVPPEQIAALIGTAFIGSEAFILVGLEKKDVPVRKALRSIGTLIAALEQPRRKR